MSSGRLDSSDSAAPEDICGVERCRWEDEEEEGEQSKQGAMLTM